MEPAPIINDYRELNILLEAQRQGKRVVCTIGSWDILHRGHVEYLRKARELGEIVVVGIDSDIAYQRYKKKPSMYPQEDRQVILSALRYVDYVVLVEDVDKNGDWQMEFVRLIKPDIFLCNYQSFPIEQRRRLSEICSIEVVNLFSPQSSSVVIAQQMKTLVLRERESNVKMRLSVFCLLAGLLSLSLVSTITILFLNAFNITNISQGILYLLIGKTVPEIFGMMYIVIKYLFPLKATKGPDT